MVFWRPQEWLLPWMFGLPVLDAVVGLSLGSLMIEYNDPEERSQALRYLSSVRQEMCVHIGDRKVPAVFHDQPGEEADRLPAVNYVTFNVGEAAGAFDDGSVEIKVEVSNPQYLAHGSMPAPMRKQLAEDLRS